MNLARRCIELFKRRVDESPMIDPELTPSTMQVMSHGIRENVKLNHDNSTKIGHDYHTLPHDGGTIYYRHDGGLKEFSYIKYHTHAGTEKNGGEAKHIHNFMKHHIDNHGKLASDRRNSLGSKKLWSDFMVNNPHYKYEMWNTKTNQRTPIDHKSLDSQSHKIWGTDESFKDIRILATK